MAQPVSIANSSGQKLDPVVDADGTVRLKLGIGEKALAGLTNVAAWQGVGTHTDLDTFVADDAVVLGAGYDGTDVRKILVDTTGQLLVDVQSRRVRIVQTPTVSSGSIYAAKDAIGGLLTFALAARTNVHSSILESVTIVDKGQQMSAMDLVLFNASLTAPTDNAAFDPTDTELLTCIGVVKVVAGDYFDFNDNSVAVVHPDLPIVVAATSLYGVLVSRGTPTYTSTSDIVVSITVRTD
jgi:hypothetical protein